MTICVHLRCRFTWLYVAPTSRYGGEAGFQMVSPLVWSNFNHFFKASTVPILNTLVLEHLQVIRRQQPCFVDDGYIDARALQALDHTK